MTNQSPASTSALSASATTNFLASFNTNNGGNSGLSKLFESLLSATATINNVQKTSAAVKNAQPTPASGNDQSNNSPAPTIGQLISDLHQFLGKWDSSKHNDTNNKSNQSSNSQAQNATSVTSSSANSATQTNTTPTTSTTTSTASTDSTTTSSNDTTTPTDPNAPPSFSDLLAQMQAIMQMLQKQIQTAQNPTAGGFDVTAATDNNNQSTNTDLSLQGMLTAGGALADLLALAQQLEKKFDPASSASDAATTATNTNAIDPQLTALDLQMRSSLKDLMDKLQAAATTAAKDPTTTDATTTKTSMLVDTKVVSNLAAPIVTATKPDDIIKAAVNAADDFMQQLKALHTSEPTLANTPMAVTGASSTAAEANGDAELNNNRGNHSNLSSTSATQAAPNGTGETQKSNPYSFASQLSAMRAQNGGTAGLQSAVEQVLLLMNKNAKSGNDQMSIQLHPADLGTINVKLDFAANGTVSGTVIASNADTLNMLQKDSRSLERALQDAGLRADPGSLQFSLGGQSQQQNNSGQTANNSSSGNNSANTNGDGFAAITPDSDDTTTDSWVITPGRVNIRV